MIIILSILITMILLTIGLNIGIKDFKKLRGIVEDEKLIETIKKFPCNTEICKQTLKKLNKEDVKVEEDNSSKTSVYLVFKNKIVIGKANVITRIQTVIHECIHTTQDKRLLKFNVIFANINNLPMCQYANMPIKRMYSLIMCQCANALMPMCQSTGKMRAQLIGTLAYWQID